MQERAARELLPQPLALKYINYAHVWAAKTLLPLILGLEACAGVRLGSLDLPADLQATAATTHRGPQPVLRGHCERQGVSDYLDTKRAAPAAATHSSPVPPFARQPALVPATVPRPPAPLPPQLEMGAPEP